MLTNGQMMAVACVAILLLAYYYAQYLQVAVPNQQVNPNQQVVPTVAVVPNQQVISVPAASVSNKPTFVGCYTDKPERALPLQTSGYSTTLAQCIDRAKAAGTNIFAMQNSNPNTGAGECWLGDNTTTLAIAQRYGPSTNCKPIADVATAQAYPNSQVGLPWANALYTL